MYSCILKSDVVMNVTVFACVVGLLFMVKCVFVVGVGDGGGYKGFSTVDALIQIKSQSHRLMDENIQCLVYLNLWRHMWI